MGFLGDGGKSLPAGWGGAAKPCDSCKYAAALLFCRADSLFLCMSCDSKLHEAGGLSTRHERVWLCEVCEQAPASVTCKADAAALCVTCDRDIHSANPLARRHERVPVVPFYDTASEAVVKSSAATSAFLIPSAATVPDDSICVNLVDNYSKINNSHGEVPASWIDFPNSNVKLVSEAQDMKSIDFFLSDSDQFLDFDFPVAMNARFHHEQHNHSGASDSVVPVQTAAKISPAIDHSPDNHFEIDFSKSKLNSYSNTLVPHSLNHSVSSSSMDVGVVPEGSSMSDMSYPLAPSMSQSMDLSGSGSTTASQLSGMDREARVLRYREKRKNRKFEKTIRYASRKAYAETRPRIKGRFAKRTEVESEIDNFFSTSASSAFMADSGYGVVPSF